MDTNLYGKSDETIQKATGKSWVEWIDLLKKHNADNMPHKEIATWLNEIQGVDGWWAQSITVGFERAVGRRDIGQRSDGKYEATASKAFHKDMDETMQIWMNKVEGLVDFNGTKFIDTPNVTSSERGRAWRVKLKDGTKVNMGIYPLEPTKSSLAIQHEKIESKDEAEKWKVFWRDFLEKLHISM